VVAVWRRIGDGEALPSRFEQDVDRDGEAGNFRLEDDGGATTRARRSRTAEAGRRRGGAASS